MPDPIAPPPADGQPGAEAAAAAAVAAAKLTAPPETPKTFTQAELDAIVQDRVRRAVPSDYEALKVKAAKVDEADEAAKTDLQKAIDARVKAETESKTVLATSNSRLIRATIHAEAADQSAIDRDAVVALLVGDDSISVDAKTGEVVGVKEAVAALLKAKPYLVKTGTAPRSGGEFGGSDPGTIAEQISTLERAGKFREARALKIQQGLAAGV